tara:strand:+ start:3302 stop:3511 length:210 start_codon:yes stop_codon:yes gene_type:complete
MGENCKHTKWECQLYYGAEGQQIHCVATCEGCGKEALESVVTHDGKVLTVKPKWAKRHGGDYGFHIREE